MKDLIFITAYCPTEEQERALDKCVDSVLNLGFHVALISHSHVSIHIQKKCQFYVYDYNNDVSTDYKLLGHNSFSFGNQRIQSRFFNKTFYGFAIYRMFSIVSQIAINYGYKNIHHIEYDCELLDKELIHKNSELLEEYDSVIYTNTGNESGFLFGAFKSFKVASLPDKFKNYDREFIENEMKVIEPKQLEVLTKKLFIDAGKVYFQKEPTREQFKRGTQVYNRQLHYTVFYDPENKTINLFYNSIKKTTENIVVIVNKNNVFNLEVQPYHWYIRTLGIFDEITDIRIDNTEKIIYEQVFDDELREVFKIKSHISKL
jgi:hypothetical protein